MAKSRATPIQFNEFYTQMLGPRWESLRAALSRDPTYEELEKGLIKPYFLDKASAIAARALEVESGDRVLDMCAAPGGKSLILSLQLGEHGTLVANDRSSARRDRLHRVLDEHLPKDIRKRVSITGHDATKWCLYEQDVYDKILLDVPCSSERHVLASPKHLAQWSPARSRHLSVQAYAMLAGATRVLKPGGVLLYSTCTLSDRENDHVIAKLLRKRGDDVELIRYRGPVGEETEFGWRIWPDTASGAGPIFFTKLKRR